MNNVNEKIPSAGNNENNNAGLKRYLSPLSVWALAFGCSVGWGAFVMPGTTFLPIAGPLGTVIGILLGAGIMFVIGMNYHYLMNRYSGAGGTFTYAKNVLGNDHGFLGAWFVFLTYVAIIWANATALSLIVRYLFGDLLCFGFRYNVAGYTVYFGEVLLSVIILVIACAVCILGGKAVKWSQTALAALLFIGITVCFIAVTAAGGLKNASPAFAPTGKPASQIFAIIALAPWAFIGFESVSHSTGEFSFNPKKTIFIMAAALLAGALAYVMLSLTAVGSLPEGYSDWSEYVASLGGLEGLKGLPTFYTAEKTMGAAGKIILGIAAFAGITTGLIANYVAASRLLYSMAENRMLPSAFAKLGKQGTPKNALIFIAAISVIIPFLGRTAIGWIVDVTTIGATIAYAYVSVSAFFLGHKEHAKLPQITGITGGLLSVGFAFYYLMPTYQSIGNLAAESYLILAAWSILGILLFRILMQKDETRRFGKSEIVWIVLLMLILVISFIWIRQSTINETADISQDVVSFHNQQAEEAGLDANAEIVQATGRYINDRIHEFGNIVMRNVIVQFAMITVSVVIIFSIFSIIKKRESNIEAERMRAEESSKAKSIFLSNMSHDIRTPMNAITGYTTLALQGKDLPPETRDFLMKIDYSGKHLLSLINDILDMSRIESGKMELSPAPTDITATLEEVYMIFSVQMETKKIKYTVDYSDVKDKCVMCDKNRIIRILLNLVSNAYKFTPSGGEVSVILRETERENGFGKYELRVKDTGIGMSKEFAEHIFEAFERERTDEVKAIQGSGLGMAITKNFIDLMGGSIKVESEQGKGTEFIAEFTFETTTPDKVEDTPISSAGKETVPDLKNLRVLVVEDNFINIEIATMILKNEGFEVDIAENGKIALDTIEQADADKYDLVLMDIQMPVMNGYEATRAIRALPAPKGDIPIIAMSANAFEEDVREALSAGMNAHVTKPIDVKVLTETIRKTLYPHT